VVLTQESGSKQPHGHPAFTNHPSQITKHITKRCLVAAFPSALPLFSPPLVNPFPVIFVEHIFPRHAPRPAVLCIPHCHLAETPPRRAVSITRRAKHQCLGASCARQHRAALPPPDELLSATGTAEQSMPGFRFVNLRPNRKLPCIYKGCVSLSCPIKRGAGCAQHHVIGHLGA